MLISCVGTGTIPSSSAWQGSASHGLLLGQSPEEEITGLCMACHLIRPPADTFTTCQDARGSSTNSSASESSSTACRVAEKQTATQEIPTELPVELTGYFPRVFSPSLMDISVVSLNLVLSGMNRRYVHCQGVRRRSYGVFGHKNGGFQDFSEE